MEGGRTRESAVNRMGAARLPVREGGDRYVKQGSKGFKTWLCVYSCRLLFVYARMSFKWGAWMISSSLSRVGEGNKECSQSTVLLEGLDEKCEFGQKGITLKGVKANQKMSQQCSCSKVSSWKSIWLATSLGLGCQLIPRQTWHCWDGTEKKPSKRNRAM